MDQKELPRIAGKLRSKYLEMPEEIYRAQGIVIMGKRIKSVIFTTDIAIIRSCNADAVLAVKKAGDTTGLDTEGILKLALKQMALF